jgi:hypothetical protein
MSYPEDTPLSAFCIMEGHRWGPDGSGICTWCGERLRCQLCGQFTKSYDNHEDRCPWFKTHEIPTYDPREEAA